MPDSTTPSPDPTPADAAAKRKNAAQDKKITNYANTTDVFLTTLINDPTLKAVAQTYGYDDTALAVGTGLVTALGGGVQQRQQAIGEKTDTQGELNVSEETVRDDYAAFRLIARASFPKAGDRKTLALSGDVPDDLDLFVGMAKTSYTNAGGTAYTAKMTLRNYAPARLTALLKDVGSLVTDESKRDTSAGGAEDDTKARDKAHTDLREWMKELQGVLRGALRGQTGQLAKLKL